MKPRKKLPFLAVFLLAMLIGLTVGYRIWLGYSPQSAAEIVSTQRVLMGTEWSIQVVPSARLNRGEALRAIDSAVAELRRVESVMSEWIPDSPVSVVNASAGAGPVTVPAELLDIIKRGVTWGKLTDGAFDITWHGAGRLWNFDEDFAPPEPLTIARALANIDYRKIRIQGSAVWLEQPGMSIGLGGIAKGYAIDRAGLVLQQLGATSFLVNGGGDILTSGDRGGRPWRIGIRNPRGSPTDLIARLKVTGGAVVTSGDYERFKIVKGIRYHHIIDPRTGTPARQCRSVTVVAPRTESADVLATALFVLGPAKGLALAADQQDTEAFIIDSEGKFWMTDHFKDLAEFF